MGKRYFARIMDAAFVFFNEKKYFFRHVCVCCVFSSNSFWTSSSLDVPAGVTQEEDHTGFLIHLLSAVRALIFLARRIQPFLSLVDREVEFCVLTIYEVLFCHGRNKNPMNHLNEELFISRLSLLIFFWCFLTIYFHKNKIAQIYMYIYIFSETRSYRKPIPLAPPLKRPNYTVCETDSVADRADVNSSSGSLEVLELII